MADPVLDLNVLNERACVRINGQDYELLNPGELDLLQYIRLEALGQRLQTIEAEPGKASEAELTEVSEALARTVGSILKAPEDVLSKLGGMQRFRILLAFFDLAPGKVEAPAPSAEPSPAASAESAAPPPPSIGDSNSPA